MNGKKGGTGTLGQGGSVEQSNIRRIEWQNELIRKDVWQCCLNCEEWSDGQNNKPLGCKLHQALPPIAVIVVGCKDHMTDIPF
jgi:hypothetical protein